MLTILTHQQQMGERDLKQGGTLSMAETARSLFVTATGTDLGKTYVAERLIREWREAGWPVTALKPVVSGYDPMAAGASDTGRLLAALDMPLTAENVDRVSPWRFTAPLSPDMAAAMENRSVPYDDVLAWCQRAVDNARQQEGRLLIEGIGGVMVPLDDRRTVLDLMADLSLPVLLVTGSYLGSLSHTLTACAVLQEREISLDRIVISETPESGVDLQATRDTLARFLGHVPIDVLPFTGPGS